VTPRKWRRGVGVLVVAITATLAWAGGETPDSIVVTPRLTGVKQGLGSNQTMTVMVKNQGAAPFAGRIVGNCGPAPAMRIAGGTGDPLSIPSNVTIPVAIECPTTLPVGMHRCTFDIQSSANISVSTFDAFCATFSSEPLTAATIPVEFTNQQVGVSSSPVTLTITNPTAASIIPLSVQVDNPNFLVGKPCNDQTGCDAGKLFANSTAPVDVLCRPLASGTHVGHLFLVGSNGVALPPVDLTCNAGAGSGSGGPVLTVNPPNVTIGNPVEVAGGTANATVELVNGGTTGSLTTTSVQIVDAAVPGAANDWTFTQDGQCPLQPCMLGPAQKLDLRLTFNPSGFNARPATLLVNYSDPDGIKQASIALDGDGIGAAVELIGAPSLDFGVVPINTQAMQRTFKLQNLGNRTTSVALSATPKDPFLFSMDLPMLDPGETTVTVGCFSATEVDATATLQITGPDVPTQLSVPLHCDVRNTQLTTNPTSVSLGELRIGTTVSPVIVTVDRVGNGAPIPLTSAALSSSDPNLTLGALAALSTPAMVTLGISPTIEGPISTAIVITPGVGEPVPVPVTGSVVTAELTSDDVMTLGTFCVDQPVSKTAINLTSTGTATIQVTDVQLALGDASPFELEKSEPTTYPTSLAPEGGRATVLVAPKRSSSPNDDVRDMLVWSTDAGQVTSVLTTRFIADGGAVAPQELDFEDEPIHIVNDDAKSVTLQNCSTDPLQLLEPVVPAPFELTGEFPLMLEPAAKATISLLFLPRETGEVTRELTIESMAGETFTVTLRGNGITGDGVDPGDDDGPLDETSFYACGCRSSGDPSSVLVIALAILVVFRRRVSR
jgi:hypothetical protein